MARLSLTKKITLGFAAGALSFVTLFKMFPAYQVDGTSMTPTLENRSLQFASKLDTSIERFSIYVAKIPGKDAVSIKRLVGMPGDKLVFSPVTYRLVSVNGNKATLSKSNAPALTMSSREDASKQYHIIPKEMSLGDFTFSIYEAQAYSSAKKDVDYMVSQIFSSWVDSHGTNVADGIEITVPEGEVFMMSDNLINSIDSRETGTYPIGNIIDKVL